MTAFLFYSVLKIVNFRYCEFWLCTTHFVLWIKWWSNWRELFAARFVPLEYCEAEIYTRRYTRMDTPTANNPLCGKVQPTFLKRGIPRFLTVSEWIRVISGTIIKHGVNRKIYRASQYTSYFVQSNPQNYKNIREKRDIVKTLSTLFKSNRKTFFIGCAAVAYEFHNVL